MKKTKGSRYGWAAAPPVAAAALLLSLALAGTARALPVTEDALREAAESCVREQFAGEGDLETACGSITNLGEIEGMDLDVQPVLLRAKGRGPVHVALDLVRDDVRIARKVVTVDLKIMRDVLVPTKNFNRNEEIDPEFLTYERIDTRPLADRPFSTPDELLGSRARRIIQAGEPLIASMVEEIPVIGRGEKVVVLVSVGGVSVTATGTALQDGAPGAPIAVRNDRGGKRLQCTVVSAGVVRIETAPAVVRGG